MPKIIFNGTEYAGGSGNYFNPVIYSDTERKIGVWRDNKPLYQKSFVQHSTDVSGAGVSFDVSTLDIDTCVDVFGTCDRIVTGVGTLIYPFNAYEDASLRTYLAYSKFNTCINFNIRFYVGESTSTQYITILYTKNSDVAGSGDYNALGVPTVHYSTSEQVIGTWINNKPLYAKTFAFTPTALTTSIDVSSLQIDKLIERKGTFTRNAGTQIQQKAVDYRTESPASNNYGIQCEIRDTNLHVNINGYSYSEITEFRITLLYTKTTD